MKPVLAVLLVTLTGPNNQRIDINPHEVVSVREPRDADHFAPGVKCLIHMADGKVVTVIETCDAVRDKLEEEGRE